MTGEPFVDGNRLSIVGAAGPIPLELGDTIYLSDDAGHWLATIESENPAHPSLRNLDVARAAARAIVIRRE